MFFRVKLVAIFLAVVLALLGAVYFSFVRPISADLDTELMARVRAGVIAVSSMHRTDDLAVRRLAETLADLPELRQAMDFGCADTVSAENCLTVHHAPVLGVLQSWYSSELVPTIENNRNLNLRDREANATFANLPSLLIVATLEGTVVARVIGDVEDVYGARTFNLRDYYAVVDVCAESSTTQFDVIGWLESVEQTPEATIVAAAPIYAWGPAGGAEQAVGVVLVGFPLDDHVADESDAALGDLSLLYTFDGTIVGNSGLHNEIERDLSESSFLISDDISPMGFSQFTLEAPVEIPYSGEGLKDRYVVGRGEFSTVRAGDSPAGFVVVGRLSNAHEPLQGVTVHLLLIGILMLLVGGSLIFIIIRNFLAPLAKIDHGIQQVITGKRDFVWEVDSKNPYHAEMAHALNVMSAFLQGKPLPDEEETKEDSEWAALLQFADVEVTGSYKTVTETGMVRVMEAKEKRDEEGAKAAAEPLQAYYQRVFDEYVAARTEIGVSSGITYDRFVTQLKRNAEAFKAKAHCADVRFKVVVKDDKVVLKPIPIK